jgi:hypothetical protein
MATTRGSAGAHGDELASGREHSGAPATDCAACHAPLPEGHRYLCASCVEDSGQRARATLARLSGPSQPANEDEATAVAGARSDEDELTTCPNCGMALDASGRCAGCVTTVRR